MSLLRIPSNNETEIGEEEYSNRTEMPKNDPYYLLKGTTEKGTTNHLDDWPGALGGLLDKLERWLEKLSNK